MPRRFRNDRANREDALHGFGGEDAAIRKALRALVRRLRGGRRFAMVVPFMREGRRCEEKQNRQRR